MRSGKMCLLIRSRFLLCGGMAPSVSCIEGYYFAGVVVSENVYDKAGMRCVKKQLNFDVTDILEYVKD